MCTGRKLFWKAPHFAEPCWINFSWSLFLRKMLKFVTQNSQKIVVVNQVYLLPGNQSINQVHNHLNQLLFYSLIYSKQRFTILALSGVGAVGWQRGTSFNLTSGLALASKHIGLGSLHPGTRSFLRSDFSIVVSQPGRQNWI